MIDLRQRRKELGLTMKQVADAVGVSEATISRYESGNIKNMRRDRIDKYAKILRVDLLDMLDVMERETISIGERIRLIREERNMSQVELAERTGYSLDSIIKYENNEREPTEPVRFKINQALGIEPSSGVIPRKRGIFDFRDDTDIEIEEKLLSLNELGKKKALDYITDLTEQEKYTCKEDDA